MNVIQTVTTRVIKPGVYKTSRDDAPTLRIFAAYDDVVEIALFGDLPSLDANCTAQDLRELAETFVEIAELLETKEDTTRT